MRREPATDGMTPASAPMDARCEGTLSPEVLRAVVQALADALGETAWLPMQSLRRIVRTRGVEFAQSILRETQTVQAQGGLRWIDGSRRRTLGGVYFFLAKKHLSRKQKKFVFAAPRCHLHRIKLRLAAKKSCVGVSPAVLLDVSSSA